MGAAHDEVDHSPALEELSLDDLQMMKLINIDYNRKAPPYWSKATTSDMLLVAGVTNHPATLPYFF